MIYMLDTHIIIYLMKNRPESVARKISSLAPHDRIVMSFVTYGELLQGAEGSRDRKKSHDNIRRITQRIQILYPDENTCIHYGHWAETLKRQGRPIGNNDLWIACHALSAGATLVTHNSREFARIEDLNWQDWVEP